MSAPDTNLEKQKRRHIGPLLGMGLAVLFVIGLFLGYLFLLADESSQPDTPAPEVPAATGD